MTVRDGRYGPYVNWDKVNATLPKGLAPDTLSFDQAMDLIRAKQASGGGGKSSSPRGKAPARKAAASAKTGGKKAPAKKAGKD